MKMVSEFKLSHNKSMLITGNAGTGKRTKSNELSSELNEDEYIAAPQPMSRLLLFLVKLVVLLLGVFLGS